MEPFAANIAKIRERARSSMAEGAMTPNYQADPERVAEVLNQALATEIVCVLRYKYHYYMAKGLGSQAVRAEFLQHAAEEQVHADRIAARIVQLNGKPDLNPANLAERSHADYAEGDDLVSMIREDLIAERIAIETYREIIKWLAGMDPTSSRLMKEILEQEEEHAEDLATLLDQIPEATAADRDVFRLSPEEGAALR